MLRACDALLELVADELPALVYADADEVLVRRVAEHLLDNGLAAVGPTEILAAARELGLSDHQSVELERLTPFFCQRLLDTLAAAGAMPLKLVDFDQLISTIVASHLDLDLPASLEQAARAAGLVCRGDLPSFDA